MNNVALNWLTRIFRDVVGCGGCGERQCPVGATETTGGRCCGWVGWDWELVWSGGWDTARLQWTDAGWRSRQTTKDWRHWMWDAAFDLVTVSNRVTTHLEKSGKPGKVRFPKSNLRMVKEKSGEMSSPRVLFLTQNVQERSSLLGKVLHIEHGCEMSGRIKRIWLWLEIVQCQPWCK